MPKSMTGYGRASAQDEQWLISWEIRSLNNRHLDLKWKIPPTLYAHQKTWENELRSMACRGGVELFLSLKIMNPELQSITLDTTLASAMLSQLQTLAEASSVAFSPDVNRLLAIPSLWKDTGSIDNPRLIECLTATLRLALADWNASRKREGEALEADLRARLNTLRELVRALRPLAESNAPERMEQLRERLNKLLEDVTIQNDEARMTQEFALLADRVDVSEELTRLDIHLDAIKECLSRSEAVGRKLDFMVQECFREINTCGNKSQNSQISQLTVEFKAELEKCREQIQNLE